ncbi:MAG: hypothetical protein ACI84O_000817 [Myxococcota bacterium]|jgi:hypothetical protein
MKKTTLLALLLLSSLCAPLANIYPRQSPDTKRRALECPDTGVEHHDAKFTPTQIAACEWGFLSYTGFGLDLRWEDPVCPTTVIWEPPYQSTIPKANVTFQHAGEAHAQMIEFVCDEETESCHHSATHSLPGAFHSYIELPC